MSNGNPSPWGSNEQGGGSAQTEYDWNTGDINQTGILSTEDLSMFRGWKRIPQIRTLAEQWLSRTDLTAQAQVNGFLDELESSSWWKDHSAEWRDAEWNRYNDPGTYYEQVQVNIGDIGRYVDALGYAGVLSDDQIYDLADDWAHFNYTEAEIERELLDLTYYSEGWNGDAPSTGTVKDEYDRIKSLAKANLMNVSDDWIWRQAHNVITESTTATNVDQMIVNLMKTEYDFLDPDMIETLQLSETTLSDHLNPVMEQLKATWGDSSLSWDDQWIKDNLVVEDEEGNKKFLNSAQAKKLARQDERYLGTSENKSNMRSFSSAVQQMFGVV